ncbi:MAG: hypothetical protein NTZ95_01280 [Candidatus Omnitrophica bacterium]|nr:hypothetical protein [Candidatus Omnitrophota bacterium]
MRNAAFVNSVILVAVVFLSVPLIRIYSEAPELAGEFMCDSGSIHGSYDLFVSSPAICNLSYRILDDKTFIEDTVSYLAKYEKSPPVVSI